ncbi:hypothetical protein [Bosea sp. PAMC 26642]|uniref:hypothetical protein n=1 Tax=Bosea sp. (strain PAMC 26642) TaxID=1792307 RepID=UPI00076FF76E|nr:hypothetical protein [Bosea sp. PAMC 26642]AMJ60970.1 hypothetical protein AXW83_12270 [Bosea sp. PAMC 26642]
MPVLMCGNGSTARAYRATAHRVRGSSRVEIEIDLGLIGTGDVLVSMQADVARDLAREINRRLDEMPMTERGSRWLDGARSALLGRGR